ncbi:hypothetical protein MLD38_033603 [Melastoma candidum]|uniref:Uncharacterized protein n=1 Tax=Melastoma candidum TaxID=119954 RepID=A0ACB9M9L1_9MYRT|nr:hypothetical protein MLD38_033603 [Melastoma candidum]
MYHLVLVLTLSASAAFLLLCLCLYRRRLGRYVKTFDDEESTQTASVSCRDDKHVDLEELVIFQGGEDLTISDILDAPGEVIGKSNYGTLYRALLQGSDTVRLLRYLRPACAARGEEFAAVIRSLGQVSHPNLVPLLGFYNGPQGEKLLVHPFYPRGNLAGFIRDGSNDSHRWATLYKISVGIARGLDHLHTGIAKPLVHGNLKSKNILLDHYHQPYISDFALYTVMNPTTAQEMMEASEAGGYKAPELIKMREATPASDVYSYGIILLEMLTGKEAAKGKSHNVGRNFLPNYVNGAILSHRVSEVYHPDILLSIRGTESVQGKEGKIVKMFQLALSCCSPSPALRPNIKQVLWKLEAIWK